MNSASFVVRSADVAAADDQSCWVFLLVQRPVPVTRRLLSQFPHWGEVSLLCQSAPFTFLQCVLSFCASVIFPLFAVAVVHLPLCAGQGRAVGVVVVETIPETLTVFELTQVIFTGSWWPPLSFCRPLHSV